MGVRVFVCVFMHEYNYVKYVLFVYGVCVY